MAADDGKALDEEVAHAVMSEEDEPPEDETSALLSATSEDVAETTWLIPYGNMVTILMIFFLVLYAFSQQKTSSFEKAIQKMQHEISSELEKKKEAIQEKETEVAEAVETFLKEQKIKEYAQVELSAQRIRISLSNPVLFDSGRAAVKSAADPTLTEIATLLKGIPNAILVEGHTDSIPISGRYRSNFELSAARAFAIIEFFIRAGVDPARFSAFGYGEFRPVASNDTEEGRAKNRRIEISILREASQT